MLVKHNLEIYKSVKTPIFKGEDKSFLQTNELIDITMHRELIDTPLYLANITRHEISYITADMSELNS